MKPKPDVSENQADSEGRFAYEGLDRVIHERARLSVLTSLITHAKGVTFNDLKQLCPSPTATSAAISASSNSEEMVEIVKGHEELQQPPANPLPHDGPGAPASLNTSPPSNR